MNENIWIFIVIALAVILAVLLYNMYREQQYRDQVRRQFGHSDKDALLDSRTESVRDGRAHGKQGAPLKTPRKADLSEVEPQAAAPKRLSENEQNGFLHGKHEPNAVHPEAAPQQSEAPAKAERSANNQFNAAKATVGGFFSRKTAAPAPEQKPEPVKAPGKPAADLFAEPEVAEPVLESGKPVEENVQQFQFERREAPAHTQEFVADKRELLLDLHEMAKQELSWFDSRFDYLAYVSLREPHELHSLPRLSGRHRFQIAGCTMDNRWQIAEPIPSVYYQGFIVGMQAISRSGLASVQDLEAFGSQVNAFAEKLGGALMLTDIEQFLAIARPLDEVCERVDQTIAMHLVSRSTISGVELRGAVERLGFELAADGAFYFNDSEGSPLFSIVNIDNSAFTSALLDSKAYRGFSVLFDLPHVPAGEKQFNQFMDLVVRLSAELSLDLVNDKLEELSTEWLKNVRSYVLARQEEMQKIGIEPGGSLAQRLFS